MTQLEELSEEIQKTTKTAETFLDDLPPAVHGAWGAAKNEAQAKLKKLKEEYKATILRNGVAIFVGGDAEAAAAFAKLVRDDGEGLVVDASALYERLATAVESTISDQRTWGVQQTQKLHLTLQVVMHDLGLKEIPMPAGAWTIAVPTYAHVLKHVREVVREATKDNLNRLYTEAEALREALEIRYTGVMVPVVFLNASSDEFAGLASDFARGHATVSVGKSDKIDKEFLAKAFREVNKKIRKK